MSPTVAQNLAEKPKIALLCGSSRGVDIMAMSRLPRRALFLRRFQTFGQGRRLAPFFDARGVQLLLREVTGARKVGAREAGAREVGVREFGAREVGARESEFAKIDLRQSEVAEPGASQRRAVIPPILDRFLVVTPVLDDFDRRDDIRAVDQARFGRWLGRRSNRHGCFVFFALM